MQHSDPIKLTVLEPYYPGRNCPVCGCMDRRFVWMMNYNVPQGWPLPYSIAWFECEACGMLYGDGQFDQHVLNRYYREYYGYGVDGPENIHRLNHIAVGLISHHLRTTRFVDYGGGAGIVEQALRKAGWTDVHTVNVGDYVYPSNVDILLASHVLEHIYNLPETMQEITRMLKPDGTLIIDGPDATGLARVWDDAPILDFNTKHINHFRLLDYLNLAARYGFELVSLVSYEMEGRPHYRLTFERDNLGDDCRVKVTSRCNEKVEKLKALDNQPVNVWGLADVTWHLLSRVDLNVVNYIDNDPAYRGRTYAGKPVLERPDNDYPIVILAQSQRGRLVENIRTMGVTNEVIQI